MLITFMKFYYMNTKLRGGGEYLSTRHTTVGKTFLILNKCVKLYIQYIKSPHLFSCLKIINEMIENKFAIKNA